MKALTIAILFAGIVGWLMPCAGAEPQNKLDDKKSSSSTEKMTITIWILGYERRDGSAAPDEKYLPSRGEAALAKLKDKGVKKLRFNFEDKQLAIWSEGKQELTEKDIQAAMPGVGLKLVAKAVFPDE